MIVITLHGLPPTLQNTPELRELVLETIPVALAGINDFVLSKERIFVFAQEDMLSEGLGEEVIAFIDGTLTEVNIEGRLFDTLRQVLTDFVHSNIEECGSVDVLSRLPRVSN
jgi:hypothetical protein